MKNIPEDKEKQFFRNRFDDFESEPEGRVWENIKPQLPGQEPGWLSVNGKRLALWSTVGFFVFAAWLFYSEHSEKSRATDSQIVQSPPVFSEMGKTEKSLRNPPKNAQNAQPPSAEDTDAKTSEQNTEKNAPSAAENIVKIESRQPVPADRRTNNNTTGTRGNVKESRPVANQEIGAETEIAEQGEQITADGKRMIDKTAVSSSFVEKTPNRRRKAIFTETDRERTETAPQAEGIATEHNESVLGKKDEKTLALPETENIGFSAVANRKPVSVAPVFSFGYFGQLQARPVASQFISPTNKSLIFKPVKIPQIEPQPQKQPRGWQLYGGFTHWMNYYQVSPVQTDSVLVSNVRLGNALASQRSGWQLQAGAVYPLSEKLSLRGGLFYLQQHQTIVYQTQSTRPVSTTIEAVDANSVQLKRTYREETHTIENRQQQLGVRADALYQLGSFAAFRHYAAGGAQIGLTKGGEASTGWSSGVQIGYGLVRPLGRTVEFWLEPTFRYTLQNPYDPLRVARIRPYAFGIQAGLLWRLPPVRR